MGRAQSSKQSQLERDERRCQVARMTLMGLRASQIADRLGISIRLVYRDLEQVRADWVARSRMLYADWIAEQLARLDNVEQQALESWLETGRHQLLRVAATCIKQRCDLLGLNKPQRVEISGPEGGPIGFEDLTDEQLIAIATGSCEGAAQAAQSEA